VSVTSGGVLTSWPLPQIAGSTDRGQGRVDADLQLVRLCGKLWPVRRYSRVLEAEAEPASTPRLVAVVGDAAGVLQHPAACSRFHVMNVVLRLVKSFSGPPEPASR
jgi:hypothetical protein